MKYLDIPWLLAFLTVALVSVRLSKRFFGTWFSPVSMYVGMNALSMAGYHVKWLAYHDISLATHGVLLVSMSAFVLGTKNALGRNHRPENLPESPAYDLSNLDRFFYLTAIVSTIGWVLASIILVQQFGLGSLVRNIWMLQTEFQMQYIGYMNVLGILVLPIHMIRYLHGRAKLFDVLLVGATIFGLLLSGIKSYTILSVTGALVIWGTLRPGRFRPAHLMAAFGILLAFFIAYTARIDIFVSESFAGSEMSQKYSMLQRPYLYFTGSWPALESVVTGVMSDLPYWGYITFQPLWKTLSWFGLFDVMPRYLPFATTGVALFNVYSFAGEVFWDWGWYGVAAFSWALGFSSTRLYLRARLYAYWGHALIYGIVGYGVFMSTFAYYYHFKMMLLLLYTYLIGFVLLRGGVFIDRRRRD